MMNSTAKIVMVIMSICLGSFVSIAQDSQYSQFYANPLYLNPALAGNDLCPKLSLNYRNQWPGISGNFNSYSIAYDKFIDQISGGLGVLVTHDQSGAGGLTSTSVNLIYAYTASLNKVLSFKAGMQVGYFQNTISWDKLEFADMYDGKTGSTGVTNETQGSTFGAGIDVSAGGMLYSDKMFGGISVHHLTEPEQNLFGYEDSKLKRRVTIHSGAHLEIESGFGPITLSPNFLIENQHNFYQYNVGCYIEKSSIVLGGWYRFKDAIVVMVGMKYDKISIGYSFDYSISKLGFSQSLGAHEISCTYKFKCGPKKRKKYRSAACPKF